MNITKNSMMNIGLVIILLGAVYLGGRTQGKMETKLEQHELLDMHDGAVEAFVPKEMVDLQFEFVQRELNELKAGQKEILKEIAKK